MSAAREKDQADFDLERFVDMFDEALTSQDPRVIDALRGLMMMVTLTRPETRINPMKERNAGPLRRMFEDMNHLHRRIERVEEEVKRAQHNLQKPSYEYPYEKYMISALGQQHSADDQARIDRQIDKFYNGFPKGLK